MVEKDRIGQPTHYEYTMDKKQATSITLRCRYGKHGKETASWKRHCGARLTIKLGEKIKTVKRHEHKKIYDFSEEMKIEHLQNYKNWGMLFHPHISRFCSNGCNALHTCGGDKMAKPTKPTQNDQNISHASQVQKKICEKKGSGEIEMNFRECQEISLEENNDFDENPDIKIETVD